MPVTRYSRSCGLSLAAKPPLHCASACYENTGVRAKTQLLSVDLKIHINYFAWLMDSTVRMSFLIMLTKISSNIQIKIMSLFSWIQKYFKVFINIFRGYKLYSYLYIPWILKYIILVALLESTNVHHGSRIFRGYKSASS